MKFDKNPRLEVEAGDRLTDKYGCTWIVTSYETAENDTEMVHVFCESGSEEGTRDSWPVDELRNSLIDGIMHDEEGRSHELVANF